MRCSIWYHLYNLKNVKNTHGGVLVLVKLQPEINTPPWVSFTFFKLHKWYRIAQRITTILGCIMKTTITSIFHISKNVAGVLFLKNFHTVVKDVDSVIVREKKLFWKYRTMYVLIYFQIQRLDFFCSAVWCFYYFNLIFQLKPKPTHIVN